MLPLVANATTARPRRNDTVRRNGQRVPDRVGTSATPVRYVAAASTRTATATASNCHFVSRFDPSSGPIGSPPARASACMCIVGSPERYDHIATTGAASASVATVQAATATLGMRALVTAQVSASPEPQPKAARLRANGSSEISYSTVSTSMWTSSTPALDLRRNEIIASLSAE